MRSDELYRGRNGFSNTDIKIVINQFRSNILEIVNACNNNTLYECIISRTYYTGDERNMTIVRHVPNTTQVYVLSKNSEKPIVTSKYSVAQTIWENINVIINDLIIKDHIPQEYFELCSEKDIDIATKPLNSYFMKLLSQLMARNGDYDQNYNSEFDVMVGKMHVFNATEKRKEAILNAQVALNVARNALLDVQDAYEVVEVADKEAIEAETALEEIESNAEDETIHLQDQKSVIKRKHITHAFKVILAHSQEYKCNKCKCLLEPGWHTDHIVPLWNGGTDTEDNLQALCTLCHLRKTSQEAQIRSGRAVDEVYPILCKKPEDDNYKRIEERLSKIESLLLSRN